MNARQSPGYAGASIEGGVLAQKAYVSIQVIGSITEDIPTSKAEVPG